MFLSSVGEIGSCRHRDMTVVSDNRGSCANLTTAFGTIGHNTFNAAVVLVERSPSQGFLYCRGQARLQAVGPG